MAKKSKSKKSKQVKEAPEAEKSSTQRESDSPSEAPKIPKEVEKKLKQIKIKLDKFSKKIRDKFEKYIMGVALLPPPKPSTQKSDSSQEGEKIDKDKINVLVLVDDSEPTKMSKQELKEKLATIIDTIAKETDEKISPETILLSELWQNCYDGKKELLQLIALSAPIYDEGMLGTIKLAEIHKQMVLKKFEKYIVSYVLAGSVVQGKPNPNDIDVYLVIDDTDVKKMTRAELKDKLRAIIIGMGIEAGEITGVKGKLHVQVYILTDFWDSLKEANPIILTFLRDGVPFHDRGIFMAWKQLLKMGKIKPSPESIDMFMGSGEQMIKRVREKIKEIGMEDIYYAILTPSQAAIMLYGMPPPTPRETPQVLRDLFVKKEKLLENKFVDMLQSTFDIRKKIEYGEKKELTGKELDELLSNADKFLKRIKRLFTQIEKMKEEESMVGIYDSVVSVIRDVLRLEGIERFSDENVETMFKDALVDLGRVPDKFLRILGDIVKAKKDYETGKLTKHEVDKVRKESMQFIKHMVEYLQRKRGRELEKTKIRVKHGEKIGEVILLGDIAYIIHDIDAEEKSLSKAAIKPDGSLGTPRETTLQELEKALAKTDIPPRVFIKQPIFDDLKKIFGKDVEVLITY
ncbi:hypothetical protein GOV06_03515 [Candidatus Woesearchaeota archaeon]|nr:hypothetical protein [Candidatus Woesearchaeota archaeon]